MAGANNAQFKARGYKAKDIAKRRAEYGKLTMDIMERNDKPLRRKAFDRKEIAKMRTGASRGAPKAPPAPVSLGKARSSNVPAKSPLNRKAFGDVATLRTRAANAAAAATRGGKIMLTPGKYTWKRDASGNFSASDGRAKLEKNGKNWTLVMRDGSRHSLGKKASFDKAEQAMARLGAR